MISRGAAVVRLLGSSNEVSREGARGRRHLEAAAFNKIGSYVTTSESNTNEFGWGGKP